MILLLNNNLEYFLQLADRYEAFKAYSSHKNASNANSADPPLNLRL